MQTADTQMLFIFFKIKLKKKQMKTKLLRRLRRRAYMAVGMTARVFNYNTIEYSVGARLDIWRGNFHHLDHYYNRQQAEWHLRSRRRKYILSLVRGLWLKRAQKETKRLSRKLTRL